MEKLFNVRQTLDLELLWFFLNHLPMHARQTRSLTFHSQRSCGDFESMVSDLWKAENRLLGLSSTGPMGSMVPRSLTQCR